MIREIKKKLIQKTISATFGIGLLIAIHTFVIYSDIKAYREDR